MLRDRSTGRRVLDVTAAPVGAAVCAVTTAFSTMLAAIVANFWQDDFLMKYNRAGGEDGMAGCEIKVGAKRPQPRYCQSLAVTGNRVRMQAPRTRLASALQNRDKSVLTGFQVPPPKR